MRGSDGRTSQTTQLGLHLDIAGYAKPVFGLREAFMGENTLEGLRITKEYTAHKSLHSGASAYNFQGIFIQNVEIFLN